jgi:hypothetical protein
MEFTILTNSLVQTADSENNVFGRVLVSQTDAHIWNESELIGFRIRTSSA